MTDDFKKKMFSIMDPIPTNEPYAAFQKGAEWAYAERQAEIDGLTKLLSEYALESLRKSARTEKLTARIEALRGAFTGIIERKGDAAEFLARYTLEADDKAKGDV